MLRFLIATFVVLFHLFGNEAFAGEHNRSIFKPEPCTGLVVERLFAEVPGWIDADGFCVPHNPEPQLPPVGYKGDFYVDEFTDEKIKATWQACLLSSDCANNVNAANLFGLGLTREFRQTGTLDPVGRIDPHLPVDLRAIRRPAFFGPAPHNEVIATLESQTYTVEFTMPPDGIETNYLGINDPVRVRGWYLQGAGIERSRAGQKRSPIHPLWVALQGRTGELTAIDDLVTFTNFEVLGASGRRTSITSAVNAGFDVLIVDARAHGISGGRGSVDLNAQADDILRMLSSLESGENLRVLTPNGAILEGASSAGVLIRHTPIRRVPLILDGTSQGSASVALAVHKTLFPYCTKNLPEPVCTTPDGYDFNIRGVIMQESMIGGLGHFDSFLSLAEGNLRTVYSGTFYLDSEVLSGVHAWPATLLTKGLWDELFPPLGDWDAYQRMRRKTQLLYLRGPHGFQGLDNAIFSSQTQLEFARGLFQRTGKRRHQRFRTFPQAMVSSPPFWEPSSDPRLIGAATE